MRLNTCFLLNQKVIMQTLHDICLLQALPQSEDIRNALDDDRRMLAVRIKGTDQMIFLEDR